jgi:hypothetical protein
MRILAGVLALILGANGLFMLFGSLAWYGTVPGVTATGPFNPHFVRDIGAAYVTAAGGIAWFGWKPREGWPALVAAAAFLTMHAAIHVFDATCGPAPLKDTLRDLVGVHLTALVALILALRKPEGNL